MTDKWPSPAYKAKLEAKARKRLEAMECETREIQTQSASAQPESGWAFGTPLMLTVPLKKGGKR